MADKTWDPTLKPNAPGAWWIDWRQGRTDSAGGTTKVIDYGRHIWRARFAFSRREQQNELNYVFAFVLGLRGWLEPFKLGVFHDNDVRLGTGGVTAASAGIVGTSLQTVGWTIGGSAANGKVMKAGQFIDMSVIANEPRLQMLTEDATATGGAATLKLTPGIQIPTGASETVHYRHHDHATATPARATVILSNPSNLMYQLTSPLTGTVEVEVEEWWPDRPQ